MGNYASYYLGLEDFGFYTKDVIKDLEDEIASLKKENENTPIVWFRATWGR